MKCDWMSLLFIWGDIHFWSRNVDFKNSFYIFIRVSVGHIIFCSSSNFSCGTKKAHRILNLYCLLFIWTFQKWRFNNWIEIQWTIPLLNKLTTFPPMSIEMCENHISQQIPRLLVEKLSTHRFSLHFMQCAAGEL